MTFIHSHPDSTDPCEEAEEGGREGGRKEGGMFLSTRCFPLFLPLKQILVFPMGGGRGGGRDLPQGEQGEGGKKQSGMG